MSLSPTETVGEAARRALALGVDALVAIQAPAEKGEVEPLHQLRVSSRRLRASLEIFSGVLYASQLKIFRRDLPWIAAQAGAVRECDIISALLKDRARRIDPDLAESVAPMLEALEQRRVAEQARLCEFLQSKRYRNMLARLSRPSIRKAGAERRLGLAAGQMLRSTARSAIRKGGQLADAALPDVFHKLRVRIKRLRYALEMFGSLGAKHHKRALARLEELQELLGLYNDTMVASAWLKNYAGTAGAPPQSVLAAGALIQSLGRRAEKLRRRAIKAWRRFERSDEIRDSLEEIRNSGRLALLEASITEPATSLHAADASAVLAQPPDEVHHSSRTQGETPAEQAIADTTDTTAEPNL